MLVFSVNVSNAEIVKSIQINGNERVSDETIKIYGNIKLNKDYNESDLNKILNNLFSTNFFEDVRVEISKNVLIINLTEYAVVRNLTIVGEERPKYVKEIKKQILLKEKNSFIETDLSKSIDIIKSLYASLGFNFTEINSSIKKIDDRNVDLILEIIKGKETKISKITFSGDKKVKEKRLRDIIASEENRFWKFISKNTSFSERLVNLDKRLLINYYKSVGYYDVSIVSNSAEIKKSGEIELIYTIDAGKRYFIKKITTEVDTVFDKNLFFPLNAKYQKYVGSYYSPFKIKKLLEEIDEIIADNNLQFVEHSVEEIIDEDSINIKFKINEGSKVLVERINITGNNITNESVIRSELLLDEGDPFTNLNLDKSIARIKSRNIFKSVVSRTSDGTLKDSKIIEIKVEEKPTGELSAGAGIGTSGGTIAFNIQENNWLGEGKQIGFDVEINSESLKGTINYTNPNYDFLGNSINYYVSSADNNKPDQGYENTLTTAGINTSFEQYKDVYASLGLSATYDDLATQSTASNSLKKQAGTFSELSFNYGFSYDQRDRTFMPTNGSIVTFNQSFPIYADKSFISNSISTSVYNSFSEDLIGAGKFLFTSINGIDDDDVRISKRKSLSNRRLRGFERGKVGPIDGKDHVGGNYAAALNFEAQLPKFLPESTKTDVALFLDFGNVWGVDYDTSIDSSNKIRSSAGAAANWISPIGPMSFTFSTNLSKASTDVTESFNFNLGTTF
jgi:outer membrane protein insertion porin family